MDLNLSAPCGLYCGACPVFLGEIQDVVCKGCLSDTVTGHCATCKLKLCVREKGIKQCLDCESYPCPDFIAFRDDPSYTYHKDTPANMMNRALTGEEKWLEIEDVRHTCAVCGKKRNWKNYRDVCSHLS